MIHSGRARFFFWLGVLVLPVFWAWFTLARTFLKWERFIAFSWLATCLVIAAVQWHDLRAHLLLTVSGSSIVTSWITIALWVWLLCRVGIPTTVIEYLLLIDVVAILNPGVYWTRLFGVPFSWNQLILPLIPAILHLWVDPFTAWQRRPLRLRSK